MGKTDNDPVSRADLLAVLEGRCPYCDVKVAGRRPVSKLHSPEAYETMDAAGIVPETGHRKDCSRPR